MQPFIAAVPSLPASRAREGLHVRQLSFSQLLLCGNLSLLLLVLIILRRKPKVNAFV